MLFDLMLDEGVQDDLIKAINDKDYLIMTYTLKTGFGKREIVPVHWENQNLVMMLSELSNFMGILQVKTKNIKFFRLDRIEICSQIFQKQCKRFHRFHLPDAFTFGKYNPMDKTMSYVSNYKFSCWESTPKQEQPTTLKTMEIQIIWRIIFILWIQMTRMKRNRK